MKTTKERILSEGLGLIARYGLSGVTIGMMAQHTRMSKSTLFAHFGSKEDVQLGLLTEAMRVAQITFVEAALAQPGGLPRLKTLFDGWLGWSEKAELQGGCPIAAAMFELDDADINNAVRQRLVSMEQEWRGLLIQLTRDAIIDGDLSPDLDEEQFVWEIVGIYLAHHVAHRFVLDRMATHRAMTAFNALLFRSARPDQSAKRSKKRPSSAIEE